MFLKNIFIHNLYFTKIILSEIWGIHSSDFLDYDTNTMPILDGYHFRGT
jgi:hypothetical protein